MKLLLSSFFVLFALFPQSASAVKVETVTVFSPSMKKEIKAVVILPDIYKKSDSLPVLYLLHGYGGNYSGLIKRMPILKQLSERHNFIIVCPDGNGGSWYLDSPIDPNYKYETHVSKELVGWIDNRYKTIKNRNGRAISGISMGGHGALYIAFRHQDLFGAAGSMSGAVDFRPWPQKWELKSRLGSQDENPENWEKFTVMGQTSKLSPNSIKILFDCGTEDFAYHVNLKFHKELLYRNIPHDFISRSGKHDYDYFNNSILYHALFFSEFFYSSTIEKNK